MIKKKVVKKRKKEAVSIRVFYSPLIFKEKKCQFERKTLSIINN